MEIEITGTIAVNLNELSDSEQEILKLWYENASFQEDFLNVKAFRQFSQDTILNNADCSKIEQAISKINKTIKTMRRKGFQVDDDDSLEIFP